MRKLLPLLVVFVLAIGAFAQSKTNDAIQKQIKSLKADKTFTLTYDKSSNMSKLMVTSDNFSEADAKKAGIQAMSFGMAVFYQGEALTTAADQIPITFWVMSKKPQFAANHKWSAVIGKGIVDLGGAQYAARERENMEYLNFKISRAVLQDIVSVSADKITLGVHEFQFTAEHITLFKNLLKLTDPAQ